mmetsp:Transcript_19877/g.24096  ORF Transcript_19877/g.24096 Transcript_19877/m.24096 type:complete len:82 (-) Transcript_19877:619-864(-)|eukprot:CAMPEP_0204849076 /NCGR_PEP_ID=MMETSP1347-20130617/5586_1 /ASSEMBLY_ACC=CAM_ASM_000690 /TAXON_ID=215587 /ORGANISM="Aplanochytrium stocchinoi, Strain GSBS06" /LENGTH=81 /DNA_ID=CAMNT_0051991151 /DNA_START=305 /DNA_END=550 /DNA_ORIENTATION=+
MENFAKLPLQKLKTRYKFLVRMLENTSRDAKGRRALNNIISGRLVGFTEEERIAAVIKIGRLWREKVLKAKAARATTTGEK